MAKKTALTEEDIRHVVADVMAKLSGDRSADWKVGCAAPPPMMTCPEGNVVTVYELLRMLDYFVAAATALKEGIEAHFPRSVNWRVGCPPMPPRMTCRPHVAPARAIAKRPAARRRARQGGE